MKRKQRILVGFAAVVVLAAIVSFFFNNEPRYQGKTLSTWLGAYARNHEDSQARAAVSHIGTNALPLLVKWTDYKTPMWKVRLFDAFRGRRSVVQFLAPGAVRAEIAMEGFEILGSNAAPAIPALTNLLFDWDWRARGKFERTVRSLRSIGEPGFAPLLSTMTNTNVPVEWRWMAGQMIDAKIIGASTNANLPVLIRCLDDPAVGPQAARILGDLRFEPALVVPALARCLKSQRPLVPPAAAESLAKFGTNASAAVPDLVQALGSQDRYLRIRATNALENIAPEIVKDSEHHSSTPGVEVSPGSRSRLNRTPRNPR